MDDNGLVLLISTRRLPLLCTRTQSGASVWYKCADKKLSDINSTRHEWIFIGLLFRGD